MMYSTTFVIRLISNTLDLIILIFKKIKQFTKNNSIVGNTRVQVFVSHADISVYYCYRHISQL